jgi:NRAMP (natural resistance-associated macrophage protein)-like metal ion transporter
MVDGLLVPSIPRHAWGAALGLIGAVIMPHNLYLHSSLVLTRKINHKNLNEVNDACIYNTIESSFSLIISFIISTSVISTFAVYVINNPGTTSLNLE